MEKIPEGYLMDGKGRLIPESMVKEVDKAQDELVKELIEDAQHQNELLSKFKKKVMGDVKAFVSLSAEKYGAKLGGRKGNVSLFSYDGRFKIQLCISEQMQFDEKLQAAKALIDECVTEWAKDSRPEIKAIINRAFEVDKQGNISISKVLDLRKYRIENAGEKWNKAMDAISDSIVVVDSKEYVRFYERNDEDSGYRAISLDLATI